MAVEGARAGRVDENGRGVLLTAHDGTPLYSYRGLVVRDAAGREAEAWVEAKEKILTICVDDTGLRYPLYIDPVIQTGQTYCLRRF